MYRDCWPTCPISAWLISCYDWQIVPSACQNLSTFSTFFSHQDLHRQSDTRFGVRRKFPALTEEHRVKYIIKENLQQTTYLNRNVFY